MFRALIELLFVVLVVMVARLVLNSLIRGISTTPFGSRPRRSASDGMPRGSELHKDPVCGTYVAESTPFQRQIAGQSFYYCSEGCREKHALVAH